MSRIGKKIILIPDKVEVKTDGDLIMVKGPRGELKLNLVAGVKIELKDKEIKVMVGDETLKKEKSLWGTFRQLIANMLTGVTVGFEKKLEINGVGFKAEAKSNEVLLNVGYSHPVVFKIPENIKVTTEKNVITINGIDKQLVGEVAAQIRRIRQPEPYKGKGIKYIDEVVRRKAGKQVKSATTG